MGLQLQNASSFTTSLGLLLGVFLLICSATAENKTYPTANQNLNPMQAQRSAVYCLRNKSSSCTEQHTLGESGWLNVSNADGSTFCAAGGCAEHTRAVLLCVEHVKRDYWFANRATVKDLYDTINLGCNSPQGFTGVSKYSTSNGFRLNSPIMTAVLVTAMLFIAFF